MLQNQKAKKAVDFRATILLAVGLSLGLPTLGFAQTPYDADMATIRASESSYAATRAAVERLKSLRDPAVIEFWFTLVAQDANRRAQDVAGDALTDLARARALPAGSAQRLMTVVQGAAVRSSSAREAAQVLVAMSQAGDRSIVPAAIDVLNSNTASTACQIQLLSVLTDTREVQAAPTLIRLSQARDPSVQRAAFEAMGRIAVESANVRAHLRSVISNESNPEVQRRAIRALDDLRYTRSASWLDAGDVGATLETLAARLDDSDRFVREFAAENLILILSQLVEKNRRSRRDLIHVSGCFSSELSRLVSAADSRRTEAITLLAFDILFFGGAPILSVSHGVKDRSSVLDQIRASVREAWTAEEVLALQTALRTI
jgi:hypothetical protein